MTRNRLGTSIVAAVLATGLGCSAQAQDSGSAATQAQVQSAASDILTLVNQGKYDEARAVLAASPHAPVDEMFLEAQILIKQGRPDAAVEIYRAVLAQEPQLVPIRQLLAQILLQLGDYSAARFHFNQLMEIDQRPGARVGYANALRVIQQRIPSGVNASFAIIPSTNINRGTTNSTFQVGNLAFQINDTSREQSGIGAQVGFNGFVRVPAGSGILTLAASVVHTQYSDSYFNVTQPGVSVRFETTTVQGAWQIEAFARRAFRDPLSDYTTIGIAASGQRRLEGPNSVSYSVLLQDVTYDDDPVQSGPLFSLDLGAQRRVSPTASVSGGVRYVRGLPEADHLKYHSVSAYGGVSNNWVGGWSTYVGLEAGNRTYDADFTALTYPRDDGFLTLSGSVLNSTVSWQGFSPRVSCLAQKNRSNVAFYDYTTTECNLQITRDF